MFYPASSFPFIERLSQAWPDILCEYRALARDEFSPWPERQLYNHGWQVYGLFFQGRQSLENCVFCPMTTALLSSIPGMVTAGFSRLDAGSHIHPHIGYTDEVLRVHLTLHSNPHCALRVGDEVRHWREGECLVFDDRVEHEAWNRGTTQRTVLLMDVLRSHCPALARVPG